MYETKKLEEEAEKLEEQAMKLMESDQHLLSIHYLFEAAEKYKDAIEICHKISEGKDDSLLIGDKRRLRRAFSLLDIPRHLANYERVMELIGSITPYAVINVENKLKSVVYVKS